MRYLIFISLIALVGCGEDNSKQITNLQKTSGFIQKQLEQQAIKISDLDKQVKNLKNSNRKLHQLIENTRRFSQTRVTQAQKGLNKNQVNESKPNPKHRQMAYQLIKGMSKSRNPQEISKMLNERRVRDIDGKSWTMQSINTYMRKKALGPYQRK